MAALARVSVSLSVVKCYNCHRHTPNMIYMQKTVNKFIISQYYYY